MKSLEFGGLAARSLLRQSAPGSAAEEEVMQATVLYGAGDVRFEDRADPAIVEPTDAVVRLPVTCICGSDLWPYRGIQSVSSPTAMGHEYCGFVEEVGRDVTSVKPGQFVIGSFFASDNTCPHCRHGYQTSCQRFEPVVGAQAPHMRVPLADGTLVATRDVPDTDMIPSLLALSDVMGTGWFAADAANVKPGATVVVGVSLDGQQLFFSHVRLHGGPAPVRNYLPKLIDLVFNGTINPGKVFDLVLPLAQVADGYRAMDERRAIKTLLQP
jgi:threonine dehydrogenase-like Zn-dependent dehydrogenase